MTNNNPSNYDLAVGFLQVFDLLLNVSQTSNDELMKELQSQDSNYFEKLLENTKAIMLQNNTIIQQNDEILRRLKNE